MRTTERYVNLFTDFGFKKIFGEEVNKNLMLDFLNELLKNKEVIKEITYLKNEHSGRSEVDRKAIFDLYCENEKGEKFIVEVQRVKQKYFKDRSLYYSTFAIQDQAVRGKDWNYELQPVYLIGIMDFTFDNREKTKDKLAHHVQLMETETKEVFYDKLTHIYLEIPKFTKTIDELETHFDKWLYALKNLHRLDDIPAEFHNEVFTSLFRQAEILKFDKRERNAYEDSLKDYRDLKGAMDTMLEEGFEAGMEAGMEQGIKKGIEQGLEQSFLLLAQKSIEKGFDNQTIAELTGLSIEKIEALRQDKKDL